MCQFCFAVEEPFSKKKKIVQTSELLTSTLLPVSETNVLTSLRFVRFRKLTTKHAGQTDPRLIGPSDSAVHAVTESGQASEVRRSIMCPGSQFCPTNRAKQSVANVFRRFIEVGMAHSHGTLHGASMSITKQEQHMLVAGRCRLHTIRICIGRWLLVDVAATPQDETPTSANNHADGEFSAVQQHRNDKEEAQQLLPSVQYSRGGGS